MPQVTDKSTSRTKKLVEMLANINCQATMHAILHDLCTPAELKALSDRLHVLPEIAKGTSYRDIHAATGVSITTIGRVARHIQHGHGGYATLIKKNKDA